MIFGDYEPLSEVSDTRLEQVADRLRSRYSLPESAAFFTYLQPPTYAQVNGIERPVPPRACFAIALPNPRHPQFTKVIPASMDYADFRTWEKNRGRLVDYPDPVWAAYTLRPALGVRSAVEEAVEWSRNMAEMTPRRIA